MTEEIKLKMKNYDIKVVSTDFIDGNIVVSRHT
jgi:hypothetical protein